MMVQTNSIMCMCSNVDKGNTIESGCPYPCGWKFLEKSHVDMLTLCCLLKTSVRLEESTLSELHGALVASSSAPVRSSVHVAVESIRNHQVVNKIQSQDMYFNTFEFIASSQSAITVCNISIVFSMFCILLWCC